MNSHIANRTLFTKSISLNGLKKISLLILLFISASLNAQLDFGDNQWNVNCYNTVSSNATTLPTDFRGSYTQNLDVSSDFGFNTTKSWGSGAAPSSLTAFNNASGTGSDYTGTVLNASGRKFSFIHKRKGFPVGNYKITMKAWDDNTYLFINGVYKSFSGEDGWGSNRLILNCFELNSNSTIEVRTANSGGGITQAILEIVKTDVLITESTAPEDVCSATVKELSGSVRATGSTFNQDLYNLNFEAGFNDFTSNSDWQVTAGNAQQASGSSFMSAKSPISGNEKWFQFGSFSTLNLTSLKISFRQYYQHKVGTQASVQISTDNLTWSNIKNFNGSSGNRTFFGPVEVNIPAAYSDKPAVYIRFLYTSDDTVLNNSNTDWFIDDIIVTGNGAANITYQWTPSTGLSDPNIANPTFTVNSSQTYTVTATAGNCTVTKDVVINMIQVPAQSVVQSLPGSQPNEYAVVPVQGVTYTWTTIPAAGVGEFPKGNTGSTIEFNPIGNGDLVVTPSNACGNGFSLKFNNPLPVELTNFGVACDQGVAVSWSTGSEKSSDFFIVEKSRDLETWNKVATGKGAGNSNVYIDYSVVDPNSWNGIAYYRLRQVDFNGAEKIYGPISSSCENTESSMIVYPNPTKGAFKVEIGSSISNPKTQLHILDATGKLILSHPFKLEAGMNQLYFNAYDLPAGVYIIKLIGGTNSIQPMRLVIE